MNSVALSFLLYSLLILVLGLYSARRPQRDSRDFFLAGRKLGPWLSALSYSASAESGWVTLGLVGMAFKIGVAAFWILPGTLAAFLFSWFVLAPRLRRVAADCDALTLGDVFASLCPPRLQRWMRALVVGITLLMLTTYVAAQFTSSGKAFQATFGWPYAAGVMIGTGMVLLYTGLGGFRAVAWTDGIQALLMVASVTLLPAVLLIHLGGWQAMLDRLASLPQGERLLDPTAGHTGPSLLAFFALWLGIPLGYAGQPHILARFMAARDRRALRRGAFISIAWTGLLFSGAVLLGVAARAAFGTLADPEKALPIAAVHFLPGWLAGMMIAAVLAAVCSTADSQLLVCGGALTHDVYGEMLGRRPHRRRLLAIHRLGVVLVGLLACGVALLEPRIIFHFVLYSWAGLGAAFGPALIAALFWRGATAEGILAGMLGGFAMAILWGESPLKAYIYELPPAFAFASACIVLVSRRRGA